MCMTTDPTKAESILAQLSRVLWQQRDLIEVLEYRLEVQQLLMVAGRADRLPIAVGEVEAALEAIRAVEETRLRVVADAAAALGLPHTATLTQIRTAAPEPWDYVLGDHHTAFVRLVASTEELSARSRELAHKGLGETRAAFSQLGGTPTKTYGRHGDRTSLALPPTLVDQQF